MFVVHIFIKTKVSFHHMDHLISFLVYCKVELNFFTTPKS